ncbi:hypothetical protein HK099_002858 [Clydaea vesicula]|uniref:Uncharacterized protein n=1 Tax=Clydaea vesicula TaxID=447962 RepID=A0AAD5U2B4_9FUNG|nr:hypothetical protein HK099_002858 [Clydaea vesicula]
MIAVLAPGIPEIENVKNCKIDVILNIPKGWQFTLTTFDYRGFLDLSKKVKGKQVSAAFFKDKSIINEKDLQSQETLFDSLSNGDYTIRDSFAFNSWSRCGLKAKLNIDTKIKLRSLAGAGETAQGLITVDSLDSKLIPNFLLLGHKSSAVLLNSCKIESDELISINHDNALISVDAQGEIIIWDIFDGRSLYVNSYAFDGAYPTDIKVLFVSFKQVNLFDDWIYSIYLQPAESHLKNIEERVFISTFSGQFLTYIFDERSGEFSEDSLKPQPLPEGNSSLFNGGYLCENRWDLNMFECECYLYYLGAESDIVVKDATSEEKNEENLILLAASDYRSSAMVDRRKCFADLVASKFSLVSICKLTNDVTLLENDINKGSFSTITLTSNRVFIFAFLQNQMLVWDMHTLKNKSSYEPGLKNFENSILGVKLPHRVSLMRSKFLSECSTPENTVTFVLLLMEKYIAIGFDNGHIKFLSIASLIFSNNIDLRNSDSQNYSLDDETKFFIGHTDKITAMVYLGIVNTGEPVKNILISGSADCSVRLWNTDTGALLGTFITHAASITTLIPISLTAESPPPVTDYENTTDGLNSVLQLLRLKNAVLSIGEDNSFSLIDVDEIYCKTRFVGQQTKITNLYWKVNDEVLIAGCESGEIYVWQVKIGHLDRIEKGSIVDDILAGCDWTVSVESINQNQLNHKKTLSLFNNKFHSFSGISNLIPHSYLILPLFAETENSPYFTILVNVKRLINEIHNGQYILSPTTGTTIETKDTVDYVGSDEDEKCAKKVSLNRKMDRKSIYKEKEAENAKELPVKHNASSISNSFSSTLANVQHPHFHHHIGKSTENQIIVKPSEVQKVLETKNINSNCGKPDSVLINCILSSLITWRIDKEVEEICIEQVGLRPCERHIVVGQRGACGYLSIPLRNLVDDDLRDTSLKFWCISKKTTASRLLQILALSRSVLSMKGLEKEIIAVVTHFGTMLPKFVGKDYCYPSFSYLAKYWHDSIVPGSVKDSKKPAKIQLRATIILGMLASTQPKLFSDRDCKIISECLVEALKDDPRGPYCIAATEIIGRGFATFEPFINGSSILRTLIQLTGLSSSIKESSNTGSPTKESQPVLHGTLNSNNLMLSNQLMKTARQAVVQIATVNGGLFASTVTLDLSHSKSASERMKPLIIYPHLPQIVESIVKSLDPNTPFLRDTLQPLATLNLSELVRIYPMISFHAGTQRLAVGTQNGQIVTYDLRTASRLCVLEQGNNKAVSAVSISKDGKLIVTFCIQENCVRFFQPTGSIFGAMLGAFGTNNANAGTGSLITHMKIFREFNIGPPVQNVSIQSIIDEVKFEWVSERGVKMKSIGGLELAFTV